MTTTLSSSAILIPLGDLNVDDRPLRHYVVVGEHGAWALRGSDDRAALAAALATVPIDKLACVPDLGAAARALGVAETPWTPELRAVRACEALRHAYPFDFEEVAETRPLAALLDACAELFAAAPPTPQHWTISYVADGEYAGTTIRLEGVVRARVGGDPIDSHVLVFSDLAAASPPDEVPLLSLHFSDEPAPALLAIRDYQRLVVAPTPLAHAGMPRAVDDLECIVLAALCHSLAGLATLGFDEQRIHVLAMDSIHLRTRFLQVEDNEVHPCST